MTPEQRAELENTVSRAIFGRTVTEAVRHALAATEAAGYSIVPHAEHIEAVRLRSRVESQRHELARLNAAITTARAEGERAGRLAGAREMREACRQNLVDAGWIYLPDDIAAMPIPGDDNA